MSNFTNQCQAVDMNREQCAYTQHTGKHTFEITPAEAAAWQTMDRLPNPEREQLTHHLANQISDRAINALHQLIDDNPTT